ncbi:MAG: hypothetical protein ACREMB_18680 [Candidatus Rokuibacteriota bacterium]
MEQTTVTRAWRVARWALVALALAAIVKTAVDTMVGRPGFHNVPFHEWYGDWREVAVVTAIFLAFVLGFARPQRRAEWRNAGVYSAFLISLFTEMFGVPLTIYLIAPALGLPATAFGMNESHLWAFGLDRLGLLPLRWGVFVVMAISTVLIAEGLGLLAVGWATVYRGRGGLVTFGIYRWLRHPPVPRADPDRRRLQPDVANRADAPDGAGAGRDVRPAGPPRGPGARGAVRMAVRRVCVAHARLRAVGAGPTRPGCLAAHVGRGRQA